MGARGRWWEVGELGTPVQASWATVHSPEGPHPWAEESGREVSLGMEAQPSTGPQKVLGEVEAG